MRQHVGHREARDKQLALASVSACLHDGLRLGAELRRLSTGPRNGLLDHGHAKHHRPEHRCRYGGYLCVETVPPEGCFRLCGRLRLRQACGESAPQVIFATGQRLDALL